MKFFTFILTHIIDGLRQSLNGYIINNMVDGLVTFAVDHIRAFLAIYNLHKIIQC